MACIFPAYVNTYSGVRHVDPKLIEAGKVFGFNRAQLIWHVILPMARPAILVGIRYAMSTALLALIIAEQLNSRNGIGTIILNANSALRIDLMIAGILVYAAIGIMIDIMRIVERKSMPWKSPEPMVVRKKILPLRQKGSAVSEADNDLVIDLQAVSKRFGDQVILDNVDLKIRRGEFVALLGQSGSGKTTLLRILLQLDHANEGSVKVTDSRTIVFQEPRLLPFINVWKNVLTGLKGVTRQKAVSTHCLRSGWRNRPTAGRKACPGARRSGWHSRAHWSAHRNSCSPTEPFASLDALTRLKMQWLVQELWKEHNPAILLITHDVDEAVLLAYSHHRAEEGPP